MARRTPCHSITERRRLAPPSLRSHVWMWHAMMGFWAGVAPASEAAGMAKYGARVSSMGLNPASCQ